MTEGDRLAQLRFADSERIRTLQQALVQRDAEIEHLRSALHAHCPNCCELRRHLGQTGWDE